MRIIARLVEVVDQIKFPAASERSEAFISPAMPHGLVAAIEGIISRYSPRTCRNQKEDA